MRFAAGDRLGPYQIDEVIGAGGMGEVYRARDTRLDRTVALKVLLESAGADASVRQRFEREARAIAQLNHPHICALYDVGTHEGASYLVMEYLDGESLADRLDRRGGASSLSGRRSSTGRGEGGRALSVEQALGITVEIAEALDRAHRQGVVHRDLTPRNVMLTRSGVKLLDFGLAKIREREKPVEERPADRSRLPTAAELTSDGMVMGTLPYMAPEQVEGRATDARTDIFALGVILYEMVTGVRPFQGRSKAGLIAAILEHDPRPMSELQPMTPPALERLVRECLAKDPDARWQSAADLRRQLAWVADGGSAVGGVPPRVAAFRHRRAVIARAATGLALAAAAVTTAWALHRQPPAPPPAPVVHFEIPVAGWDAFRLAISPDGRRIVYAAPGAADGPQPLWLRTLDDPVPQMLPGTELARGPFFSPDGRHLAFVVLAEAKLKRMELPTGTPQVLCDTPAVTAGGSWGAGTILVAAFPGEMVRCPDTGGAASPALPDAPKLHPAIQIRPHFLPDGERFVYLDTSPEQERKGLWLASLRGGAPRYVGDAGSGAAYGDGHLVYARMGTLLARPFDAGAGAFTGAEVTLAEHVAHNKMLGLGAFALARDGVLVHRPPTLPRQRLVWFDRTGRQLSAMGEPGSYDNFALSPNGVDVVAAVLDEATTLGRIWIIDGARGVRSPLTGRDDVNRNDPVWSPDGTRVAYTARGPQRVIAVRDRAGGPEKALFSPGNGWAVAEDWSRDGRYLAVLEIPESRPLRRGRIVPLDGGAPIPFGPTDVEVDEPHFSPDGKLLAYGAPEAGRWEVFLISLPPGGARLQVSSAGGAQPRWRDDGRELYYLGLDGRMMAVDVKTSPRLELGAPRPLFATAVRVLADYDQYAVTRDGSRFLVAVPERDYRPPPLHAVVNWRSLFAR